jgi:hypothetical protein
MSGGRAVALRSTLWLTLGGWIGAWAFFALVLARLVFQVLPSPEAAGHLVRPVLDVLHWYGAGAGLVLAVLAVLLRRGRLLIGLPLVLTIGCLATQLVVTPRLEAIRDLAFGPGGNVDASAEYRRLHGVSMAIFSAVLLGAIALVPLHARRDSPRSDGSS